MCDGGVVSVPLALAIVSTATSMYAQRQSSKQQEAAAKTTAEYNRQEAENQAATQESLAKNEIQKGIVERERLMRQQARQMGEMRSALGSGGFALDSGSNMNLLAESAGEAQYDAQMVSNNAEQAAWQHLAGANAARNQASMFGWQGKNSKDKSKYWTMGGTLLGGIGSTVGKLGQWLDSQGPAGDGGKHWDRALGEYVSKPVRH